VTKGTAFFFSLAAEQPGLTCCSACHSAYSFFATSLSRKCTCTSPARGADCGLPVAIPAVATPALVTEVAGAQITISGRAFGTAAARSPANC
jgi:hypothetical protein